MAKTGKPSEPPKIQPSKTGPSKTAGETAKQPPPPREIDDDDEDGDFVSPKRDRYGSDDEPL
ncbi:hypothetical protein [Bradyrhizobium sp. 930_D9_N1_4]|uniref:hypothetical protein n=1 Tax=Bradyrhizobium sp. 930_D9_N1_4 TaxID=3240374 RepID=UPI003F893859